MIQKKYGISEAPLCEGNVVVIDVLRAFTTAAFAFDRGVPEIFLVSTAPEAIALRKKNPRFLIVGEEGGRKIEGFDFGNSPASISQADVRGRTLILRSSSGTQGVVRATRATSIFLGSLVVARATTQCLQGQSDVTFLAIGSVNGPDKEEDLACADYMHALFLQTSCDLREIVERVVQSPSGQQALDPTIDFKSAADLECAVSIDKFNFAMPVYKENGHLISRPKSTSI